MKSILITGKNSYIGSMFKAYIERAFNGDYRVRELDTVGDELEKFDFSGFDTVLHVAGIAHIKETAENASLYYEVNRDLTLKIAQKAKAQGVKQFVFLSSMSVYGNGCKVITPDTPPCPVSNYGRSKLQAEEGLCRLQDKNFRVAMLRPPMVYGKGCKGNFQTMVKLVKKTPIFPDIKNRRSMIYIDNLCEFIKLCIDEQKSGVLFPQNDKYVQTTEMVRTIADCLNKKVFFSKILGVSVRVLRPHIGILNKAFGDLVYSETEKDGFSYCVTEERDSFKNSI